MSKVQELHPTGIKETLEHYLDQTSDLEGVIVLVLRKDGSQELMSSSMTQSQKSFLKCFFDSYVHRWFNHFEFR